MGPGSHIWDTSGLPNIFSFLQHPFPARGNFTEKYLLQNCAGKIVIYKKKKTNIHEKSRSGPGVPYVEVKSTIYNLFL
jgi:hypothetical protein